MVSVFYGQLIFNLKSKIKTAGFFSELLLKSRERKDGKKKQTKKTKPSISLFICLFFNFIAQKEIDPKLFFLLCFCSDQKGREKNRTLVM